MKKPGLRKFIGCPTEIRLYVDHLEHNLSLHDSHRAAVIQWETTMMRLVGEDGIADVEKAINKLKARAQWSDSITDQDRVEQLKAEHASEQRKQLDQFAMAALPVAAGMAKETTMQEAAALLSTSIEDFNDGHAYSLLAFYSYNIAKAMQAESQKRQGGAV